MNRYIFIFIIFGLCSCSKNESTGLKPDDPYIPYHGGFWKMLPASYNNNFLFYNLKVIDDKLYCGGFNSTLILGKNNQIISHNLFKEKYSYFVESQTFNKDYLVYAPNYNNIVIRNFSNPNIVKKINLNDIDTGIIQLYRFDYGAFFINNSNELFINTYNNIDEKIYSLKIQQINDSIIYSILPNPNIFTNNTSAYWGLETNFGKYFYFTNGVSFHDFNDFKPIAPYEGDLVADYYSRDTVVKVLKTRDNILFKVNINGNESSYNLDYDIESPCVLYKNYIIFGQDEVIWIVDYTTNKYKTIKNDYKEGCFDMIIYDNKIYIATISGILYRELNEIL